MAYLMAYLMEHLMNDSAVTHARRLPVAKLSRPAWLPERVWPFETLSCDIDGSPIAFTDVGSGPVLLFVHTGLWSFIWRDVIERLSTRFRCICFDAPGTGRSGRRDEPVRLELAARAVSALIERLGLTEFDLVVHDLGGLAGVAGAARTSARVRGVIAINAFAWRPEGRVLRAMLRIVGSGIAREIDAFANLVPRITATSFGVGRQFDVASRRAFRAPFDQRAIRSFHDYLRDALHAESLHAEASRALDMQFADAPVTTIFGERNDPFHFQSEWRRRFPNAVQLVIPRGNHFPMCDDPAFVANAIEGSRRADEKRRIG
jgi:pimeloyl-ACP methyl ester carboxylesterase